MQCCPSCNNELPERAIYCGTCGAQAKCKVCRDILDLKASFCVSCGTPVGEGASSKTEHIGSSNRANSHNIIEFSEDAKSRHFRAEVTDTAINSVSQPLALFLGTRIGKQANRGQRQNSSSDEANIDALDNIVTYEDNPHPIIEGTKALPVHTDLEVLGKIFRRTHDNRLKLNDSRLKQESQIDFVKRLTVLFLFAHELDGQETVSRADLNAVLSDAKIYDGNARSWITTNDLIDQDEDSVGLALPGRDFAHKVLNEYRDPQIENTWSIESKNKRRSSKARSNNTEVETAEGNKPRKGRRARSDSYTAKVKMLFDSDFFTEGRTGIEVQAELERKGFRFELRRISEALLSLTKKNALTRNQNESGEWVYKNGSS